MKKLIFIIVFFVTATSWTQETASVQVITRSLQDKVMLRWAVDQPLAWKKANEYGFLVERSTISRNGEAVVPIIKQMLTASPLKPRPLMEWETLANQDQNIAVLAQALFGNSFKTTAPSQGTMGKIMAVNDEIEQRFTFGLLAAEQNFQGALLAGWALEDKTVVAGEKYVYRIRVALPPESTTAINEGSTFAGVELYEPLPVPIGFTGAFKDRNVLLSWNYDLLSTLYTSYIVERSEDGTTYQQQNKRPIFNASDNRVGSTISMYYTDSIPNGTTFHYKIKGKTAFGETGPASQVLKGRAIEALGFAPRIYSKEIPDDNTAILKWEFKEEENELITGFELRRANKVDGPFTTVEKNIIPTRRETTFKGLKRINYFTIVAIGKNGTESPSFATIVQPVDSIPPKPPVNLKGVADTTGIVTLSWDKNLEEDLGGYRIFRSNNPTNEFSEVTNETYKSEIYTDTVVAANLNKTIYYKLQAEDLRYNRSELSQILAVKKPDVIAPSAPIIKMFDVTEKGIRINWIPSSSTDVASHNLYRKTENDTKWEQIKTSTIKTDTTFFDTENLERNKYSYTIIATDSTELESKPATAISVFWQGKTLTIDDIKFSGTVNRELRFINLSWKVKEEDIVEYRLYRGTTANDLKLYKTLEGTSKGYNDVSLEINTNYTYGLQLVLNGGRVSSIKKIELKY
ncbi:hypothetical protein [Maribacter sp.]|uniref:fibronectin type III domain-containing protein n=1 Tax=Maribacter sp. TaxID=1897614 RepID=UPI003297E691